MNPDDPSKDVIDHNDDESVTEAPSHLDEPPAHHVTVDPDDLDRGAVADNQDEPPMPTPEQIETARRKVEAQAEAGGYDGDLTPTAPLILVAFAGPIPGALFAINRNDPDADPIETHALIWKMRFTEPTPEGKLEEVERDVAMSLPSAYALLDALQTGMIAAAHGLGSNGVDIAQVLGHEHDEEEAGTGEGTALGGLSGQGGYL